MKNGIAFGENNLQIEINDFHKIKITRKGDYVSNNFKRATF